MSALLAKGEPKSPIRSPEGLRVRLVLTTRYILRLPRLRETTANVSNFQRTNTQLVYHEGLGYGIAEKNFRLPASA